MQKKLIAVAVAGALGAPAMALAQNATVNVYGAVVGEYASIKHGNRNVGATDPGQPYQRVDQWQNPGSALGFRGEEKLGGGLSAWFQCESTIDYRGSNNTGVGSQSQGLCNRDSAMGIKGAFGNVFMGNWGTPFKRVTNDLVGANDTGVFGVARILYGGSSTYGISPPAQNIANLSTSAATGLVTNTGTQTPVGVGAWRRRQSNLIAYDTPNFRGFTGMVGVTAGNNATGATSAQLKPRLWSIGGIYNNGPLALGVAYEKHKDFFGAPAAGCPAIIAVAPASGAALAPALGAAAIANNCLGSSERAWALTGSYTFSNNLKLGAQYSQQKADVSAATGANTRINTWHIGIDWMISGPHGVRAAYSRAGDTTGTLGATSGVLRPAVNAAGSTGASQWQIRYVHMLSKRTELTVGYSRLDNKANANYEMGGTSTNVLPGSDSNAVAVGMVHKF